MLRSNSKSLENPCRRNPEEEKERLQWEGFAEKEGFKPAMKEWVGDSIPRRRLGSQFENQLCSPHKRFHRVIDNVYRELLQRKLVDKTTPWVKKNKTPNSCP